MKTLLVKRLESSFFAFTQSIGRFQKAIDNMINMFENDRIFVAPDLDINKLLEEGLSYDQIEAKINEKGGNNKEFKTDAFEKKFIALLKSDKEKIDDLVLRWSKVKQDPKLNEFSVQIQKEFFQKKKNQSGKLIIFTESKETAEEITKHLQSISKYKILTVSSENRKFVESVLMENFDANLEEEKWKNDFDIVVTTEVLAEGINLHRSNMIVNYDVPWNATRLMQRIGRVNRIGSRAKQIFVYNFYPSAHGDEQIKLVNNALRKLQSFHTAFGEDNKIFSLLEEKGEGALFGNKIQKEESDILKYLNELRDFKKKNGKRFDDISKIPNKARCGRQTTEGQQLNLLDAESGEINYPLQNTSLTYLKSDNHPGIFCLITPEFNIIEMNFLQAVKIYKADEQEKAVPLHKQHHTQTVKGLDYFREEKNQENIQTISRKNLSPAENKAITNINAILKISPTEQKKMAMQRTLELIKKGTYGSKGLPKSINDFFVSNSKLLKEPTKFVEQLFIDVLDRYDLSAKADSGTKENKSHQGIVNPKIVLTQSFV